MGAVLTDIPVSRPTIGGAITLPQTTLLAAHHAGPRDYAGPRDSAGPATTRVRPTTLKHLRIRRPGYYDGPNGYQQRAVSQLAAAFRMPDTGQRRVACRRAPRATTLATVIPEVKFAQVMGLRAVRSRRTVTFGRDSPRGRTRDASQKPGERPAASGCQTARCRVAAAVHQVLSVRVPCGSPERHRTTATGAGMVTCPSGSKQRRVRQLRTGIPPSAGISGAIWLWPWGRLILRCGRLAAGAA
jgi:hypothetical protein